MTFQLEFHCSQKEIWNQKKEIPNYLFDHQPIKGKFFYVKNLFDISISKKISIFTTWKD